MSKKKVVGGKCQSCVNLETTIQQQCVLVIFIYNFKLIIDFYDKILHQTFKIKNRVVNYVFYCPFKDLKSVYSLLDIAQQTLW